MINKNDSFWKKKILQKFIFIKLSFNDTNHPFQREKILKSLINTGTQIFLIKKSFPSRLSRLFLKEDIYCNRLFTDMIKKHGKEIENFIFFFREVI